MNQRIKRKFSEMVIIVGYKQVILPFNCVFESGFIFFQVRKELYAILVRKNFF